MDLVVLSISDISAVAGYIGVFIDIYRYRYMYTCKMDLVVLSISDISAVAGDIGVCIDIYRYRYIYRYMYRYIGDGAALREAQALLFMYVRYVYRYIYIDIYTGI